ncbi:N-acyl amino acid synthase FeeM domain-containing protein [Rubrivivax albus]|uniref:Long-chain N-acyl amino acid synthase n=1 Tax=Rubrivivax albus TaxID=2499835 RepID=A0A3S2TJ64_9BURK|nr:long-chain N-acyl amino acid synthase [Rubrivivax albus]RVT48105.1 long-chain N-acyl amino acid synthase [Rubrivivax albus]
MSYTNLTRSILPAKHQPVPGHDAASAEALHGAFTIRLAHDDERTAAGALLAQRYAWRGYRTVTLPRDQTGWRTTLTAHGRGDTPIGTLTLELDGGPEGLSAAAAFGPEVEAMRARGLRLAEFTRLAVDTGVHSTRVLAGLFHVGYIVAHRLRACDTLLLEVNPRHVRFYERMLGCQVVGDERVHPGVQAPAVLLSAPFAYIRAQIRAHAGTAELAGNARSLYPFAFAVDEESGILARLLQAQGRTGTSVH